MAENNGQFQQAMNNARMSNTQSSSVYATREVGYYRKASGNQFCPNRNEQQEKIYNEFFFVKNRESKDESLNEKSMGFAAKQKICSKISTGAWGPLILGIILIIVSSVAKFGAKGLWITLLIISAIVEIASLIMGNKYKKLSEKYAADYERSIKVSPEKLMSTEDYLKEKAKKIDSMELDKVGVKMFDFTETQKFTNEPLTFRTQIFRDYSYYVKVKGNLYSSTEQLSMWFFTAKELYLYRINFDMTCNIQEEETHEFFYNEIDDISTKVYKNYIDLGKDRIEICTITFEVTVQGQVLIFEFDSNDKKVVDMLKLRQLIRERKSKF